MIIDSLTMFSNAQKVTGAGDSEKTLDLQGAGISEGVGYLYVRGDENGLSGLTDVTLQGSDDGSTFTDIAKYTVTDDTFGVNAPLPQGLPRYIKLSYGGTPTANITAGITLRPSSPKGKRIGDYEANPNYAV